MSLFEEAMREMKLDVIEELERRIWERLDPRITQVLTARHMTIQDTAKYLHVSDQTVRRMVHCGEIPSFRVRNIILVRQIDIDEWIEAQVNKSIC